MEYNIIDIEKLKGTTIGILSDNEFKELSKWAINKDGNINDVLFKRLEIKVSELIKHHNKFKTKAFNIDFLLKIVDGRGLDANEVILIESDWEHGIQDDYRVIFKDDDKLYSFQYYTSCWGNSIGDNNQDIGSRKRLGNYICYEVERKEVPIISVQYHNVSKNVLITEENK